MFRHRRAVAISLLILFGSIAEVPAQNVGALSPSTAYRQNGKWIGYVPPHQKYSQPNSGWLFRQSLPEVTSCLDPNVAPAVAVEPADQSKSAGSFEGALLESEEPRVLPVAFEESAPMMDPSVEAVPVFDPATQMMGDACSTSCDPCGPPPACCPPPRFYGGAEYLLWWTDNMATPPLVTTSSGDPGREAAGVIGEPGTSILFGGSGFDDDSKSGGRFSLGLWLDPCQQWGLEATYFMLGTYTSSFAASNADYAILARPFYNTEEGRQDARLIVYDGLVSGSVAVTASTDFEGGEFLLRRSARQGCWAELDLLIGYRWLQLEDDLLIQAATESLSAAAPATSIDLFDRFNTSNSFQGAEVGVATRRQIAPCWSLELLGKIGVGNVNSVAIIDGQAITVAPTGTSITDGGLLAQPTNMGRYERDKIATATELGVKLTRSFGDGIDLSVGYTFLYLSDVLRAGDQIDPDINDTQLPPGPLDGAPFPQFSFQSCGFWAQGLSFGIEGRF